MEIIDETIKNFLDLKMAPQAPNTTSYVELFFKNQMATNYQQDEKLLRTIVERNIETTSETSKLKLNIYYQNKKVSHLFIKNNVHNNNSETAKRHHVVYRYTCTRDGCNTAPSYIGYTTCSVTERFRTHTQNSSSIKKHLQDVHNINRVTTAELVTDVEIIKGSNNKTDLIFLEAIYIKSLKPSLNSQNEGCDKILKIFKH
jgi:hypothetical protein